MSNTYPPSTSQNPDFVTRPTPEQGSGRGATERAADVKDTSVAAGQHVADVAQGELHKVGNESRRQARDLFRQTQSELTDQAAEQQKRVASGLRSIGAEFGSMADSSETQGLASDLAHQAASRSVGFADWLDQRDPAALLDEVKGFARRRPGTFIAIAAAAGVLAGRLTRSLIAEPRDSAESGTPSSTGTSSRAGAATGMGRNTNVPDTSARSRPGTDSHLVTDYPESQRTRDDE